MGFLSRRWYDFRLGHSNYTNFVIALVNFCILAYNFLFLEWVDNIVLFAAIFVVCYLPLGSFLGFLHRRFQMKTDMKQQARENPIYDVVLDIQKRLTEMENQ